MLAVPLQLGLGCVDLHHAQAVGGAVLAWGVVSSWGRWWAPVTACLAYVPPAPQCATQKDFVRCTFRTSTSAEHCVGG